MPLTRPSSHITGSGGERLFCSTIPDAWVPEKPSADYGVDYLVLVPEAHLVKGLRFAAQVKTTNAHPRVDGALRVVVEVSHLAYWLDDEAMPVFLIACDLGYRSVYYEDVDKLVRTLPPGWRGQETVTVSIPGKNSAADHARFLVAVREAWSHRMGPTGAVVRQQKKLHAIDPRFSVRITATELGEVRELTALEPVTTALHVRGTDSREKVDKLLRGYVVQFEPGEAAIENMPLLRSFADLGGTMTVARRTDATASLVVSLGSVELGCLANIPATVVHAPRSVRVENASKGIPVSFDLELADDDVTGFGSRATLGLQLSAWEGFRLLDLPMFEAIYGFFMQCVPSTSLRLILHLPCENRVAAEEEVEGETFAAIRSLLHLVHLARQVCIEAKVNALFPSAILPEDEEEIRRVHALLFDGEYRTPGSRWTMNVTGTMRTHGKPIPRRGGDVEVRMRRAMPEEMAFLGANVQVNIREVFLTRAVMKKSKRLSSGATRYTLTSPDGEFIQRSDRYPAFTAAAASEGAPT